VVQAMISQVVERKERRVLKSMTACKEEVRTVLGHGDA